ncbi:bile acid:sodium symporter family protein [Flaviflexus equikiangi]|nr:bile acid:sodium symporter family protein [Flaviflexus equikiangi]
MVQRTSEDRSSMLAVTVFPFIIIAGFLFAFIAPEAAIPWTGQTQIALGIIMFGMGLTLTLPDFVLVVKHPLPVLLGVVAQYVIMPCLAVLLSWAFNLSPELAVGVILVGCAPGGTSSNVITYLAKGDVALSVTMTSVSTLLAPLLTPLLTLWLADRTLDVSASDMALSIVKLVIIPIVAGLAVRYAARSWIDRALPALPWISVLGITYVVIAVVSRSADSIVEAGFLVFIVVILHNGLGYLLGYGAGRLFKTGERQSRTMSIEVGMQNSGLAATLAGQYFEPISALPAAVFSVWHNISGGILSLIYRAKPTPEEAVSE